MNPPTASEQIEKTIETYVRAYLTADSELLLQAFHSETKLLSVTEGELETLEMDSWKKGLEDRKSKRDFRTADLKIISIDVTKDAASAKITLAFPTFQFTDYLSLLRIKQEWKIVGKIYSLEPKQ